MLLIIVKSIKSDVLVHMFCLVDKASDNIFEFWSGRFLDYSDTGVNKVIFGS